MECVSFLLFSGPFKTEGRHQHPPRKHLINCYSDFIDCLRHTQQGSGLAPGSVLSLLVVFRVGSTHIKCLSFSTASWALHLLCFSTSGIFFLTQLFRSVGSIRPIGSFSFDLVSFFVWGLHSSGLTCGLVLRDSAGGAQEMICHARAGMWSG